MTGNLYVVPTPLGPNGTKTAIEDFFSAQTLAEKLNGKSFSREKKIDESKHYGKSAFARDVVDKKAPTIDFNSFAPILDRIAGLLSNYY
ncbi:hypothetical protein ACO2Q9_15240 [Variovorax sp. VNK109]|uniref:hypothetical protein n=1 Tax=Variovorax sp. VNK109 TaxID=3400919 RepID=UPI003C05C50B